MDLILILAALLLVIFIGALLIARKRQPGETSLSCLSVSLRVGVILAQVNGPEPVAVPRRLGPVNNALPRAAQVRRRRAFDPAHRPDAVAQGGDTDPGTQRSSSTVTK